MPRINFQQQLVALKDKLLAMAALSQQALALSIKAYLRVRSDNVRELLLQRIDQRRADLERIGDQATNISQRTLPLRQGPPIELPIDISEMGDKVGIMIRSAIQALLEADAKLAESVLAMDDEIDDMNRAVQTELVDLMQRQSDVSGQALNAIIVSRNLERAADHATNIAEDVIFWVRGSDVRHKFSLEQAD